MHMCAYVHALIINRMAFLADITVIPGRDPGVSSSPSTISRYICREYRYLSIPIGIYANRLTPVNVPLAISAVHDRHY